MYLIMDTHVHEYTGGSGEPGYNVQSTVNRAFHIRKETCVSAECEVCIPEEAVKIQVWKRPIPLNCAVRQWKL